MDSLTVTREETLETKDLATFRKDKFNADPTDPEAHTDPVVCTDPVAGAWVVGRTFSAIFLRDQCFL